jgi:energy-coupling factor transporter ATP-binding protein EcfA2
MLAAAAVLESPLYILDEPQAALDEDGLAVLGRLLTSWREGGSAYVLASHDLEFLHALTSRVIIMDRGEVRYDGGWEALASQPNILADIGFGEK